MKIATAAYQPEWHGDWDSLTAKLDRWVSDAARQGADLLVFPEYAGVEAGLIGAPQNRTPVGWVAHLHDRHAEWCDLHSSLARRYDVHILSGSLPWAQDEVTTNAAALCAPSGEIGVQHKMILTPYERNEMQLSPGRDLQLFETTLAKIAVLICYDSEFPLLARALVAAGADVILVPSCTEAPAGQTRVRQSCRARAIEGQCLVVQAPLVGALPHCEIIDQNTGRAGIFCPPDNGLPQDGIIAQGQPDTPGWTYADVDLALIAAVRRTGQVGNFAHWPEQDARCNTITTQRLW
ncbi:MAG: carbon-nitrogen hydrolase family protein [Pseudomonadota bacterium]